MRCIPHAAALCTALAESIAPDAGCSDIRQRAAPILPALLIPHYAWRQCHDQAAPEHKAPKTVQFANRSVGAFRIILEQCTSGRSHDLLVGCSMSAARDAVSTCTVCSSVVRAAAGPAPRSRGLMGASGAGSADRSASTDASTLGAGAALSGSTTRPLTPTAATAPQHPGPSSPSAAPGASPAAPRTSHRSSQKKYVPAEI